jgi:hypothetical protein
MCRYGRSGEDRLASLLRLMTLLVAKDRAPLTVEQGHDQGAVSTAPRVVSRLAVGFLVGATVGVEVGGPLVDVSGAERSRGEDRGG